MCAQSIKTAEQEYPQSGGVERGTMGEGMTMQGRAWSRSVRRARPRIRDDVIQPVLLNNIMYPDNFNHCANMPATSRVLEGVGCNK